MVQCVSSTETDAVSPLTDSGQSPNIDYSDRTGEFIFLLIYYIIYIKLVVVRSKQEIISCIVRGN